MRWQLRNLQHFSGQSLTEHWAWGRGRSKSASLVRIYAGAYASRVKGKRERERERRVASVQHPARETRTERAPRNREAAHRSAKARKLYGRKIVRPCGTERGRRAATTCFAATKFERKRRRGVHFIYRKFARWRKRARECSRGRALGTTRKFAFLSGRFCSAKLCEANAPSKFV